MQPTQHSSTVLLILTVAFLFSLLFFHAYPGVNWFLFSVIITAASFVVQRNFGRIRLLTAATWVGSTLFFTLYGTTWNMFLSIIALFVFAGANSQPDARSFLVTLGQSVVSSVFSYIRFLQALVKVRLGKLGRIGNPGRVYYYILPVIIVLGFIMMYSKASPFFEEYAGVLGEWSGYVIRWFDDHFSVQWFWLFVLGMIISIYTLMPSTVNSMHDLDSTGQEDITRVRDGFDRTFGLMGLRNEYKSAVFLLVSLNALLLLFNMLDVYHVWFFFEWNGEYLKQFVHEGTWVLILSIFFSMGIAVYYFRGNLNFYPNRKRLLFLTKLWIAQNAFLVISVAIRNFHYMHHFSLAYKRIAVLFFLALVLYGLWTVYQKVVEKKKLSYLVRMNSLAVFVVLMLSAAVHWDIFIVKYNFSHHKTGYLHFDFLNNMEPATLPYMQFDLETLQAMEADRNERFPIAPSYMSAEDFHRSIENRTQAFLEGMEEEDRNWREWNLADARAYRLLKHSR